MSKQVFVGLVGYGYQQITDDFGAHPILGGFRSRVLGDILNLADGACQHRSANAPDRDKITRSIEYALFAGALNEVGLPHGHIPTALLFFFNIGVEIGQLLFVVGITGLIAILKKNQAVIPRWTALVPSYSIGALAMFWVIQRLAAF